VQRVLVVADDLIWMSRLAASVERAGAAVVRAGGPEQLRRALDAGDDRPVAAFVDLNGRTYDGVAAVELATGAGLPTIAVGQHEDLDLRRRALAAGARRVYSYNKAHRDGAQLVAALLSST
jgi:DNA-binding NtrC family response regulator